MKPSDMVRNTQKYQKVDAKLRAEKRQEWNPPLLWPLFSLAILIIILALPVVISYYRKQFKKPNKE
jgi:oligopeptide transport system substrate-binding protein